jgi:ketosteroid isomerase-like protein
MAQSGTMDQGRRGFPHYQKGHPMSDKATIIRAMFAAYRDKQRQVVEDTLADDFTFTSPYDDAIDKAEYFRRCWPVSERIESNEVERIFVQGDEAFVTYRVRHEGDEFRNTEFFVFDGDRIRSVDVYFGASYRDGRFVRQKTE